MELIDGELVEMAPSFGLQGGIGSQILVALAVFAKLHGGLVADASTGFRVGRDHQELRSPDVSYLKAGRMARLPDSFVDGAPDLAVEVLSERQVGLAYARSKVPLYFDAGAQLVWLVDPYRQEVRLYRNGANTFDTLAGGAVLTLEPIVTGFELRVADIFPPDEAP